MRVGVFDSGIGGLSVLRSLYEAEFFEELIYYGDTARVPYGIKDRQTIVTFCLEALDFFEKLKIDMLIIACNTASAYALEALRAKAKFPVYGVIEAGVGATIKALNDKKKQILIIATKATIESKAYQIRLKNEGFRQVQALQTGLFVPMVEEGIVEGKLLKAAFHHYFKGIKTPDALILACTHFPLLSKPLQEFFGKKTKLIHSGEAIMDFLKTSVHLKALGKKAHLQFYASSAVEELERRAKIWLKG